MKNVAKTELDASRAILTLVYAKECEIRHIDKFVNCGCGQTGCVEISAENRTFIVGICEVCGSEWPDEIDIMEI